MCFYNLSQMNSTLSSSNSGQHTQEPLILVPQQPYEVGLAKTKWLAQLHPMNFMTNKDGNYL